MSQGRKISLIYGLGLSSGLLFWGIIAASGLGVILQGSVYLFMILKILGGLYLIWLAFLFAREVIHSQSRSQSLQMVTESTSYGKWFIKGMILNVSNPKTIIAWLAALSVGIGADNNVSSLILSIMVCMVVGILTNALYSFLFSFEYIMDWYQKVNRWINGTVSCLFVIIGVELICSAFGR